MISRIVLVAAVVCSLASFSRAADPVAPDRDYAQVELRGRLQLVKSWKVIPERGLWAVKVQDSYFYFTLPEKTTRAELQALLGKSVVVKGRLLLDPAERYQLVRKEDVNMLEVSDLAEAK